MKLIILLKPYLELRMARTRMVKRLTRGFIRASEKWDQSSSQCSRLKSVRFKHQSLSKLQFLHWPILQVFLERSHSSLTLIRIKTK